MIQISMVWWLRINFDTAEAYDKVHEHMRAIKASPLSPNQTSGQISLAPNRSSAPKRSPLKACAMRSGAPNTFFFMAARPASRQEQSLGLATAMAAMDLAALARGSSNGFLGVRDHLTLTPTPEASSQKSYSEDQK